jgi:hypothetical protein
MTKSIRRIDWAALGANLGSTLLFSLLLLSPFLWGAPIWHWLLAVAIGAWRLFLRPQRAVRGARTRRRRNPISPLTCGCPEPN